MIIELYKNFEINKYAHGQVGTMASPVGKRRNKFVRGI